MNCFYCFYCGAPICRSPYHGGWIHESGSSWCRPGSSTGSFFACPDPEAKQ